MRGEVIEITEAFTRQFFIRKSDLSTVGANPYFILKPGYRLVLKGVEDGTRVKLIITVLNKTKKINGIETRVVEERDFENGRLIELSINYFAISKTNNSVFYFGEDVNEFDEKGNLIGHNGSWRAGRNGAKPGLIMPGLGLIGARYFQEIAPGVALDRAEILSVTDTLTVPAGKFKNVLKTRETTPLEPGVEEFKFYARGVGLLKDEAAELVKYGFV